MSKSKKYFFIILNTIIYLSALLITFISSTTIINFLRKLIFRDLNLKFVNNHYGFALILWQFFSASIWAIFLVATWSIASFIVKKIYLSQDN